MLNRFTLRALALLAILGAFFPGLVPPTGLAQEPTTPPSDVLDIILIIDQSGSMHDETDTGNPVRLSSGKLLVETASDNPLCEDPKGCRVWQDQDGLPMRQVAAKYFLDYLSVDSLNRSHRVGVIYFGSIQKARNLRFPLFDVRDRQMRGQVKEYLDVNVPNLSWTDVNAALENAYTALFGDSIRDPNHKPVVVLLSDGRPELASPWLDEDSVDPETGQTIPGQSSFYAQFKGLIQQFKGAGVPIYTIALGKMARKPDDYLASHCAELFGSDFCPQGRSPYQTVWEYAASQTDGQYYSVSDEDKQRQKVLLFNTYHAIVAHLLGAAPEFASEGKLGDTQTEHITIGECRQVVLTAYASHAETSITVTSPSGIDVEPTEREKEYAIYTMTDPEPGHWTLKFVGGTGYYQLYKDCQATPLRAQISAPSGGQFPACSSLALQAQVWIDDDADDAAQVAIEVTRPDLTTQTIGLSAIGSGQYGGTLPSDGTQITGTYQLELTAHHGDLIGQDAKTIQAVLLPFLEFMNPMPGASVPGGNIPIQVGVKIGCDLAVDNFTLSQGKDTTITAVLSNNGSEVARAVLHDDGKDPDPTSMDGIFNGQLPDVAPGDYQFVVALESVSDNPASYRISGPLSVLPVTVTPTPTHTPTPGITSTPVPTGITLAKSDLGVVRPGSDVELTARFTTDAESAVQHMQVALKDVPFTLTTEDEFDLPAGETQHERTVTFHVPEESALAEGERIRTYWGALVITDSNGKSCELPFQVTVSIPTDIGPLLWVVGLVLLGSICAVLYFVVIRPRRRVLRGEIRYSSTPASVGNIPDVSLAGKKQVIQLSEMSGAEMLETELEFTGIPGPRGGARVRVISSNTDVKLQGTTIFQDRMHDLHDRDVLTAGSYSLIYENLLATGGSDTGSLADVYDDYAINAGPVYDMPSRPDQETHFDDYYTETGADGNEGTGVQDDYSTSDESLLADSDDYDFGDDY